MNRGIWVGACVFIFVLAAAPTFGQPFTETFEGGIPSTWTIRDNFPDPGCTGIFCPAFSAVPWTINTVYSTPLPTGMLNYTGGGGTTGVGTAATASSANHPGQYDISLITPPFAIGTGPFDDQIQYTINYFRVDAFEFFDTRLSINGNPSILMVRDSSSLGPPYSTGPPKVLRTIDMGFFGALPGDIVTVEFRYFSTFLLPMVLNQYVQIDNVRLPSPPIPEPSTGTCGLLAALLLSLGRRRGCCFGS